MNRKQHMLIVFLLVMSLPALSCQELVKRFVPTPTPTLSPTPTLTPTPAASPTPSGPRIEGQVNLVKDGSSSPIENALVELVDASPQPLSSKYHLMTTLTDGHGRYIFYGLQPGKYGLHVVVSPDRYDTKTASGPFDCSPPNGLDVVVSKENEILFFSQDEADEGYTTFQVTGYRVDIVSAEAIQKDLEIRCE